MTQQLPDKPSELIRLALDDLNKVERSKKYVVDMGDWHEPQDSGVCSVCLAGAVMAKTLKTPVTQWEAGDSFPAATDVKLNALDDLRTGRVYTGLRRLSFALPTTVAEYRTITPYFNNKTQFKRDMRKLARDLEGAGL